MRRSSLVLFLLFLLVSFVAQAQPALVARLRRELAGHPQPDTGRVNRLNRLAHALHNPAPAEGYALHRQAMALAHRLHFPQGEGWALTGIGYYHYTQGAYDSARATLGQAQRLFRRLGDAKGLARCHYTLGSVYANLGQYARVLDHYLQGLPLAERAGDRRTATLLNTGLGDTYSLLGEYAKAEGYLQAARSLAQANGDRFATGIALISLGENHRLQGDWAAAQRFYERSKAIFEQLGDEFNIAVNDLNLAEVTERQGLYPTTFAYGRQGERTFHKLGNPDYVAFATTVMARAYLHAGRPDSAARLAGQALEVTRRSGFKEVSRDAAEVLAQAQAQRGDFAGAYQTHRLFTAYKDSLNNDAVARRVAARQYGFDLDKKEAQIALLTKNQQLRELASRRQRIAMLIGLAMILGVVGLLWQRYRFIRRTNLVIEHEKRRSDELLLNILPSEVADELKATGKAIARHHPQVTVLFADVESFTTLATHLPPQQLVSALHTYFVTFDELSEQFDLEKVKTIGDAYLLVGGLHGSTDPALVVRCALAMQQAIAELEVLRSQQDLPAFAWRMGIHTGPVVAGVVGVKKFAYDIWGDTVNTAARMEQTSESGRINISEDTYQLVKDQFVCWSRGHVPAKNKGEIHMYFVEREVQIIPVVNG